MCAAADRHDRYRDHPGGYTLDERDQSVVLRAIDIPYTRR
jgi:hypothetical protein